MLHLTALQPRLKNITFIDKNKNYIFFVCKDFKGMFVSSSQRIHLTSRVPELNMQK
jgi:hypothetical protein